MIVIWTWWLGCQPPLLDWLPTASRLVTGQITYGHSFSNIRLHDLGSGVTSVQIYRTEGFAGFYTAVLLGPASYQAKCKSKFPRKRNSQVKEGAFYLFRCTSSNGSSETKASKPGHFCLQSTWHSSFEEVHIDVHRHIFRQHSSLEC